MCVYVCVYLCARMRTHMCANLIKVQSQLFSVFVRVYNDLPLLFCISELGYTSWTSLDLF